MGRDKAVMVAPGERSGLAERTACLLEQVVSPALEVGPGYSRLTTVSERPVGGGPLLAVAAGWAYLAAIGWTNPVLVVATDLPLLTVDLLRWLAEYPSVDSVVPTVDGRVQSLCARYSDADLSITARLVEDGRCAMRDFVDAVAPVLVASPDVAAMRDVDTPDDWASLGSAGRTVRSANRQQVLYPGRANDESSSGCMLRP
jgi:molybdopterin-guanine dinucleotide biosynthesis protein A